jgi:hypothetical protein
MSANLQGTTASTADFRNVLKLVWRKKVFFIIVSIVHFIFIPTRYFILIKIQCTCISLLGHLNIYHVKFWVSDCCLTIVGSSPDKPWQAKDYKIGIWCFSAKHEALRTNSIDWLVRNQDNVSGWGDISILRLLFLWASIIKLSVLVLYKADLITSLEINLFLPWYSWKIAELALNNIPLFCFLLRGMQRVLQENSSKVPYIHMQRFRQL